MRALLLFSALAILVAGAFLFQQMRFGRTEAAQTTKKPAGAGADDVILEIGGTQPPPLETPTVSQKVNNTNNPAEGPSAPKGGSNLQNNNNAETPAQPANAINNPRGAGSPKTIKLSKGETIYKLALKYYGSGSKEVLKDIATASKIKDTAKVAEGANVTLPSVAGGLIRKE